MSLTHTPVASADRLKVLRRDFAQRVLLKRQPATSKKEEQDKVDQQTRQALKHDQFVDTTQHGLEWATENRNSLIRLSVAVVIALFIAIGGYLFYQPRSEQANVAFGKAMQSYQTPLAQPGQQVPPGVKTFPSSVERAKAANKLFSATADKYGMTPSGKLA